MQDAFATLKKLGVFCDAIKHHNEARKSGDVKVLSLSLRIFPFDAKLAQSIADIVRSTLFRTSHPDVKPEITEVQFRLSLGRQLLQIFASPDTSTASLALDEVKIWHVKAKRRNDANSYALTFDATFGPVGRTELEFVEAWRGTQRFLSFAACEANLEFLDNLEEEEEDKKRAPRPTPMFDDGGGEAPAETPAATTTEAPAAAAGPEPVRQMPKRHPAPGTRPNRPRTTH